MSDSKEALTSLRGGEEIAPLSATYDIDFLMDVSLPAKDGSDIAVYNKLLGVYEQTEIDQTTMSKVNSMHLTMDNGPHATYYKKDADDLWLFHVHLNRAWIEIAIGGDTPVYVNSWANWEGINDRFEFPKDAARFPADVIRVNSSNGTPFYAYYEFGHDRFNRYISVRCPRMDNPAISVRAHGNYAALHWVGLMVKSGNDLSNRFVAVRTTGRLNPRFAQLSQQMGGSKEWYEIDSGVCLSDQNATITLFPKQLYGEKSNHQEVYGKFVTQDPWSGVGIEHFKLVQKSLEKMEKEGRKKPTVYKHVWGSEIETWVGIARAAWDIVLDKPRLDPYTQVPEAFSNTKWLNYVSGREPPDPVNNTNGWKVLLTIFGDTAEIMVGLLTGNIAGMVNGALGLFDLANSEKMEKEVGMEDVTGFITKVGKVYDAAKPEDKKGKQRPNTTNVLVMQQNITSNRLTQNNLTIVSSDFGTEAPLYPAIKQN